MFKFNFKTKSGNKKFKTAHHTRFKKNFVVGNPQITMTCAGYWLSIKDLREPVLYWRTRFVEIND